MQVNLKLFIVNHSKHLFDIVRGPQMAVTYLSEMKAYNCTLDAYVQKGDTFSESDAFVDSNDEPIHFEPFDASLSVTLGKIDNQITISPELKTYWKNLPKVD